MKVQCRVSIGDTSIDDETNITKKKSTKNSLETTPSLQQTNQMYIHSKIGKRSLHLQGSKNQN
jgi:hypothetical protein